MFVPFYEEKTNFEIAAELFADAAWVAGCVIGFAIALYQHFAATPEVTTTEPTIVAQMNAAQPTTKELRANCKAQGIRWNRAGQGGKHLTKAEMIARLSEVK